MHSKRITMKKAAMPNKLPVLLILFLLTPFVSAATLQDTPIDLQPGTTIEFANVETAQKILTTEDDFTRSVGPFDRKLALQSDKDVPHEQYMKFIAEQVLPWTEDEKQMFRRSIERVAPRIAPFKLRFPEKIKFIKTTGRDQGECAYCRPAAIIFPVNMIEYAVMQTSYQGESEMLDNLITHELFHVYSASNKNLRDELYGLIDFKKCNEIELPK